jgi:hypothetical protein
MRVGVAHAFCYDTQEIYNAIQQTPEKEEFLHVVEIIGTPNISRCTRCPVPVKNVHGQSRTGDKESTERSKTTIVIIRDNFIKLSIHLETGIELAYERFFPRNKVLSSCCC